ncbi:hypothetical protein POTOM_007970 [Populus tomentosa]|uniref:Uncharacterized protein n=1 Tax=Populus tomentosa TaxID=118781 RepID=A0A8X8ASK7_POPTO|nr:hypothetical protein POTOM_007970 [Populus tomentosa]
MCETQPRNRLGHSKWMARLDPPHHSPDQHLVESLSRHAFDGHRTFMLADPSSALIAFLLHEKIKKRDLAKIINGGGRFKSTIPRVPGRFSSSIVYVVYHEWLVQLLPPLGKGTFPTWSFKRGQSFPHRRRFRTFAPEILTPSCGKSWVSFDDNMELKKNQGQSLPVLMPGDRVPKFIAMACPCEPPRTEKITVQIQKPPSFPVPLY